MNGTLSAIRVRQWLPAWNDFRYDSAQHRAKPEEVFYLFSMPAGTLRQLTGIYRRSLDVAERAHDLGIQRRHDRKRSDEIARFVANGYPWSNLTAAQRRDDTYSDLRKPGWLATAVVVNVLRPGDTRQGSRLTAADALNIEVDGEVVRVRLPAAAHEDGWAPAVRPLEVIDGQHRLWAFDSLEIDDGYELPVVAFHGLDRSWQAYLFWVINIKPKKINPSLAFDLYPLLRSEDWLEKLSGHSVYRETRSQELVECLWANPQSPWYKRINMLGEPGKGPIVSQATWVRGLASTFIRATRGKTARIAGLFSGTVGVEPTQIGWGRAQQAAFLMLVWGHLRDAVANVQGDWASGLREVPLAPATDGDPAFYGALSLLSTDQGVNGVCAAVNDICVMGFDELSLGAWAFDDSDMGDAIDQAVVTSAFEDAKQQPFSMEISRLTEVLAEYDWRTSAAPGLSYGEQMRKQALRGSGGYRILRVDLLRHLGADEGAVGRAANAALDALGEE